MGSDRRVVVTGVGPLTAIGTGKQELWESIRKQRTHVVLQEQQIDGERWGSFYLAKIKDFDLQKFGFEKTALELIRQNGLDQDRDLVYLMAAIKSALDDSHLKYDGENNEIGLILAHENPGVDRYVQKVYQTIQDILKGQWMGMAKRGMKGLAERLYEEHSPMVYNMQSFMYLYWMSKLFGLHGYSLFLNNACASGLFAIEEAARQIRYGKSPVMVVAAADHPVFITKFLWFKKLEVYAEDGVMRPFDQYRKGFIFGDGGAAIILEELSHAKARGASIYAEYLGGGFTLEGWKVSVPYASGDFYRKAFLQALANSRVASHEIDLINAHGVGTGIGDQYEAQVITEIFGEYPARPLISAFKPYVGHNLGGSALIEAIILLLALQANFIPPTLNYCHPDPKLKMTPVDEPLERDLRVVAKMASGFGGYNAVGLFQKVEW